jgi:hypothetical protein
LRLWGTRAVRGDSLERKWQAVRAPACVVKKARLMDGGG